MTALLAFLKLAWPYILTAGIGGFISHELDQIPLSRLQTTLASEKAQEADRAAAAQKAAADALQAQINVRLTTEANNEKVVSQLMAERDSVAADRDLATRLLNAASHPTTPSHSVPQAAGGQPAPAARPASGGGSLTQELAAAIDECRSNADQLDALIAEIKPQL